MKFKLFSIACLMIIGVFTSSNAFSRIAFDDIDYIIASWPVFVGDWCEFHTTVASNPKVENLVVVGHVDGVEVFRETLPIVSMETIPSVSFKWKPLTAGSHVIDFIADPDGIFGAPVLKKLTMPVKPVDLTYHDMKLLSGTLVEGQTLTIAGYVENKNDIRIRETFYVDFTHKTKKLGRIDVRGLGAKETKTLKLDVVCAGDYFDITMKIDPTNVIAESNETNNVTRLFLRCAKSDPRLTPAR